MYWWVCPGFEGEGCWLPVVTDAKLVMWQVVANPPSLLMLPVRPAGCQALPPHWQGLDGHRDHPECRRMGAGPVRP